MKIEKPHTRPNLLICPLDWGIGHATRCTPVIKLLLDKGVNVIVGADNYPLEFLKKEFPHVQTVKFPGIKIRYPSGNNMIIQLLSQLPQINKQIRKEHNALQKIIRDLKIDAVISDNRFGLWSNLVPCVYITHQLNIQAPRRFSWLNGLLYRYHKQYIKKFDRCWVPDNEGEKSLAGELSKNRHKEENIYYIGPLSRFNDRVFQDLNSKGQYDLTVIISGPEPQRSIFEKMVIGQLRTTALKSLVLQGKPGEENELVIDGHIWVKSHMDTINIAKAIINSNLIISRPGHSTLMDLSSLGKRAVFVPTPGQGEQEYLARHHYQKGNYFYMEQRKFNITQAIKESGKYPEFRIDYDQTLLETQIDEIIQLLPSDFRVPEAGHK